MQTDPRTPPKSTPYTGQRSNRFGYPDSFLGIRPETTEDQILAELQRNNELLERLVAIAEERRERGR